ncbi:MAG: hypothetical protein FWE23_08330 [Chitinivibrionia bacterium]|nr:hypothetical protein [Chitinivibrionia bacterium]
MIENETIVALRESLKVLPTNEEERIRYEARLKMQRDIWSFEDAARKAGERKGRREGIREAEREIMLEIIKFLEAGHSFEEAKKKILAKKRK